MQLGLPYYVCGPLLKDETKKFPVVFEISDFSNCAIISGSRAKGQGERGGINLVGNPTNLLCKRNATSPRQLRVLSQSSLFVLFANLTTFGDRWPPLYTFLLYEMKTHALSDFSHFFSAQLERRKMADTICLFSLPSANFSRNTITAHTGEASLISSFHHAQAHIHVCSQT